MLEPCAVKVASTILRRGSHREMGLLSDKVVELFFDPLDFPPLLKQISDKLEAANRK